MWEIWGRRGVVNPLSFSMSPISPFIRLPVVVESVSRVTGPRPGNLCLGISHTSVYTLLHAYRLISTLIAAWLVTLHFVE